MKTMLTAVLLLFVMTANSQNSKLEKAIMTNLDQIAIRSKLFAEA